MPEPTTYECMVMFDTSRVSGNIEGGRDALLALFEKHKCEVIAHRLWDERRLAYPIGNQKKGIYYIAYLRTDEPTNIPEMEKDFNINELVTRYLTIKVHPKWVEPLLEVIKDERATCLRLMGDDLDDSV